MDMKTSELIRELWPHPGTSCSCETCQHMCERTPCLGTPKDMLRLSQSEHADKLKPTSWFALTLTLLHAGLPPCPPIEMVQIGTATGSDGACPFYAAGLCKLHDTGYKPTEGILSHCGKVEGEDAIHNPSVAVALTWKLPRNARIVKHLIDLYDHPRNTTPILL